MSQIVVTTIGSLGDLHPKISLALELRKRGHEVVFATHKEYQSKIEALGFEFVRMRPDNTALSDPQEMAKMMDLRKGTEYVIGQWIVPSIKDTYRDLMNCAKNADFIISSEGVLVGRIVADKLGIPWAFTVLQPLAFMSVYDPFILPVFPMLSRFQWLGTIANKGIIKISKAMTKSWAQPIHQLRQELDLPPLRGNPFIEDKYSPNLVLAMFSPLLAKPQPDWPVSTVLTGFTWYDDLEHQVELPSVIQEFLRTGDPPIVFTLGSAAVMTPGTFYQESIQAIEHLHRRAILLIGKNTPPANLPAEIVAVNYLPYSQIFARASAIVHQGGIGTTAQALYAGRPTLIVPYSHDQPDNAARVERLGASRTIPRSQYTASRVARELRALLENPQYATRAAEIGKIIRAENGVKVACDAIESQLTAAATQ